MQKGLNLQRTWHTTPYFMQKGITALLKLARSAARILPACKLQVINKKIMGGIFQVAELDIRFIHSRISFLSEAREATVYWKCIGWNGAESTWKAFDSQILLKFAITLCKTYGGSFDKVEWR